MPAVCSLLARLLFALGLAGLIGVGSGCGVGRFPVAGEVTYADGTPLSGGRIEIELQHEDPVQRLNVSADIDEGGVFKLSAPAGKYRAILLPPPPASVTDERPRVTIRLPAKYRSYAESGLEFEVVRDANQNHVKLLIEK